MHAPALSEWNKRLIYVGLTVVFLGIGAAEAILLYRIIDAQDAVGADPVFFRSIAQRWLDTGQFYTERQLSGPYTRVTLVDNLYPPSALYLFVPFTVLPPALWWALPIAFVLWTVWRLRPRLGAGHSRTDPHAAQDLGRPVLREHRHVAHRICGRRRALGMASDPDHDQAVARVPRRDRHHASIVVGCRGCVRAAQRAVDSVVAAVDFGDPQFNGHRPNTRWPICQ